MRIYSPGQPIHIQRHNVIHRDPDLRAFIESPQNWSVNPNRWGQRPMTTFPPMKPQVSHQVVETWREPGKNAVYNGMFWSLLKCQPFLLLYFFAQGRWGHWEFRKSWQMGRGLEPRTIDPEDIQSYLLRFGVSGTFLGSKRKTFSGGVWMSREIWVNCKLKQLCNLTFSHFSPWMAPFLISLAISTLTHGPAIFGVP